MKNEAKKLLPKLKLINRFFKRYLGFIVFMTFAIIYAVLVMHINYLTSAEPSETQVNDQLGSIQRPKIDQQTLDKIQKLQDQNIQIRALFNQARNNPFSE